MKKYNAKTALVIILSGILISFYAPPKKLKNQVGKFVLVPTIQVDSALAQSLSKGFYIFETEVTNLDYNEFLNDLRLTNPEAFAKYHFDTLAWNASEMIFPEPYVQHYHKHPAYNEYPAINISKEAAEAYCDWLAERLKQGYLKAADFDFEVRLPTKAEWQYAASGGFNSFIYSWAGVSLFNQKGQALCAFNNLSAQNIYTNPETGELDVRRKDGLNWTIAGQPMRTGFYEKNGFNLFDVCGNVAEMVADEDVALGGHWNSPGGDVQIKSELAYDGKPSSYVGFRPVLVVK